MDNHSHSRKKISYNDLKEYISQYECSLESKETEYENIRSYINIKCKCGNVFNCQAFAFKASKTKTCPTCSDKRLRDKNRYSKNEINEIIYNINIKNGTTYKWTEGKYHNVLSKLILTDDEGYRYETALQNLFRLPVIHKFHQKNPYTINNIKIWMKTNMVGYELVSDEYVSATDKLTFKCPNNHIFSMWFSNVQSGQRCSDCDLSYGEEYVRNVLELNDLYYTYQYSFDNCRGKKRPLPFDFAVFKDIDKTQLWFVIEYDGELHYQLHRAISTKEKQIEKLLIQQNNDKIKDKYCCTNNIPLLRIPYWEKNNMNQIITDFITEL